MTLSGTSATGLGDTELMQRVQANDPGAFEALYDRFSVRAYRVAYGIARDGARAEDVVQDAFLSIWRDRSVYLPARGPVPAWVIGIVRNRAIDALRRNVRHDTRRADADHLDERRQPADSVEVTAGERDQATRLRHLLRDLPVAQREVIALAYFGELSTSEIADELGLPLGTVKGRMRLGLEKLRSALGCTD